MIHYSLFVGLKIQSTYYLLTAVAEDLLSCCLGYSFGCWAMSPPPNMSEEVPMEIPMEVAMIDEHVDSHALEAESCLMETSISAEEIQCAICHERVLDPVSTPCGHNFCKLCLERWLRRSYKCPLDNCPLPKCKYDVNITMQKLVWANVPQNVLQVRLYARQYMGTR